MSFSKFKENNKEKFWSKMLSLPLIDGASDLVGNTIGKVIGGTRDKISKLTEPPPPVEEKGKKVTSNPFYKRRPETTDVEGVDYLRHTTYVNGKEIKAGTKVDPKAFNKKISQDLTGRKHVGGVRGPFSFLKKIGKKIVEKTSQVVFGGAIAFGAGTLTSTALTGLGGWIGSTLPLIPELIGPFLTTVLGATGAWIAPTVIGGYLGLKTWKFIGKIFRDKTKYVGYQPDVVRNSASAKDITSNIDEKEGITHSAIKLSIPNGAKTTQEGDLIINVPIKANKLGLRTKAKKEEERNGNLLVRNEDDFYGFYDASGTIHIDNDLVPTGTVIPNGSKWYRNDNSDINPVIPGGTGYREVKSFTDRELKSGPIKESIRIDREGGANFKGDLYLNTAVTFPFAYVDKRDPDDPESILANEEVRPGAVISSRSLPLGTVIPAGSFIDHDESKKRKTLEEVQESINKATGYLRDEFVENIDGDTITYPHAPDFIKSIRGHMTEEGSDFKLVAEAFEAIKKCSDKKEEGEMRAQLQKSIQNRISIVISKMIRKKIVEIKAAAEAGWPEITEDRTEKKVTQATKERIEYIKYGDGNKEYEKITDSIESLFENVAEGDLEESAKKEAKKLKEKLNKELKEKTEAVAKLD